MTTPDAHFAPLRKERETAIRPFGRICSRAKRGRSGGRLVRGRCGLRPAPAACSRLAGHVAGAVAAEGGLLRTAPRVGIGDPPHRAVLLVDLFATVVANENGSACHGGKGSGNAKWNH